jgi:hypothetical protein
MKLTKIAAMSFNSSFSSFPSPYTKTTGQLLKNAQSQETEFLLSTDRAQYIFFLSTEKPSVKNANQ